MKYEEGLPNRKNNPYTNIMTIKNFCSLICLLTLLVGCNKQKYEDFIEPEQEPTNIIYSGSDDNGSGDNDKNDNNNNGQNLLINGGLETWNNLFTPYDIPENWLCHNNYNVRKNSDVVFEGYYSAEMQSLKKVSTARIDQVIPVTPNKKIRIRFHYIITQWKDKGARTYCYFRTRSAESSTISSDALKNFYDTNTLRIIRGGGYGLTYLPHELNKWLTFDEMIEVPPEANYFAFGINSYYETTMYVDDCWVTNVSN